MKKMIVPFLIALLPAYANALTPPGSTADAQVNGTVATVASRTQTVFSQMGLQQSGSSMEKSGAEQTLKGKKGDLEVEVKLEKVEESPKQTKVDVVAKEGSMRWNNDYAKKVLDNIVAAS